MYRKYLVYKGMKLFVRSLFGQKSHNIHYKGRYFICPNEDL